ncbi:hypothetical protein CDL12_28682 [Handroanthus impetiginosus]|uniref:RNase H type-1 domain-containing protein n=1 Tax=Handroanthus impetiginosus TaxID=429701 RepID=A0A2G9G0W0_9LAMI|nr:hypothetical protein CDL12_28682 [Handroanthus impetiginosus]
MLLYSRAKSTIGIGVVARSWKEECLMWRLWVINSIFEAETAEAIALKVMCQMAKDHDWRKVISESDCAMVYFKSINREANCAADFLAGDSIINSKDRLDSSNVICQALLFDILDS